LGIVGSNPRDEVDLAHVNERLDRLEAALASVQAQLASLAAGAAAAGAPNPLAGTDPGSVPYGNNLAAGGPWLDEVRSLKAEGNLIQAIKAYREHTGVGLAEAKDAVEGMV
jgi:large subunit ribosomal protein L7/L12